MKKVVLSTVLTFALIFSAITGCTPGSSSTSPLAAIPDIANFLLKASTSFLKGGAEALSIISSSLGSGTFTVNYSVSGANTLVNQTATMVMSGATGTFNTPSLPNDGVNNITINSITNSAGGTANVTSNNTWSCMDSLGLMTYTYTPNGGSAQPENSIQCIAQITGPNLNIHSVIWTPNLITVDLNWSYYAGTTGTVSFNASDSTVFNGNAGFGISGSTTLSQLDAHGTITITATSPLLTGSFNIKNEDASVIAGTFQCQNP